MVTHDRYFLERVCNEIIELDQGKLYSYKGNYSYYLEKREARIAQESIEAHKTKLHFKKELEWMRRQPKARTTKSKSRIEDFKVIKEKVSDAFYKLDYPHDQITSYVFDVVRAEVPKMKLDDVFVKKDDVAIAVKSELNDAMMDLSLIHI